jgi:hypothetical protein
MLELEVASLSVAFFASRIFGSLIQASASRDMARSCTFSLRYTRLHLIAELLARESTLVAFPLSCLVLSPISQSSPRKLINMSP